MITRAQAEALLTLAESLEACERQGVSLQVAGFGGTGQLLVRLTGGGFECPLDRYGDIRAIQLRYVVAAEIPKHTGS